MEVPKNQIKVGKQSCFNCMTSSFVCLRYFFNEYINKNLIMRRTKNIFKNTKVVPSLINIIWISMKNFFFNICGLLGD